MTDAVIVSTARTPIGKAYRGAFNDTRAPTLAGHVIRARRRARRHRARRGRGRGDGLRPAGGHDRAATSRARPRFAPVCR